MGYMSTHEELFTFSIDSLPRTKFYVIRFKGREALNETFFFEIQLVCSDSDVDVNQLAGLHADFVFHRETDKDVVHSGCITKISKEERVNGFTYYKAEFRSLLWRAKQFVATWIYLQHNVSWLVRYLLDGENFYSYPYELRLKEKYPETDFSLQYNQSFFDYLVWRIEQQGIYYYFEPDTEKIIFADNPQAHKAPSQSVHFSSESNLDFLDQENRIKVFSSSHSILPNRVIIRNYNWIKPNEIIVGMHTISEKGIGDVYLSSEEVLNQEQADFIAKIRAEQIYSQHRVYYGEGAVSYFRPGIIFKLENHYNQKLNRSYLITEITHEGCQDAFLSLKLNIPLENTESCLYYKNSFSCIPSDVTYHPPLTAKRPKIPGCLHAFIDGDENNTPFIDRYGRYKVVFPFDLSARTAGKSSCWIRRMQEQVGKDSGLAFPLSTGTEVLIFFINGNPDLPVIKGSVPNGESKSVSGGGNRKLSGIRTEGGTQLTFDSKTSGVSLGNTFGSGFTLASDSADMLQKKADNFINADTFSNSAFSGMFQTAISGYRIQNMTGYSWKMIFLSALGQLGLNLAPNLFSILSGSSADPHKKLKDAWTLSGFNMSASLVNALVPIANTLFMPLDNYQGVITANSEEAAVLIQCFPSIPRLLCSFFPVILPRIAKVFFAEKEMDRKIQAIDEEKKEYAGYAKKHLIREFAESTVKTILPETGIILAFLLWRRRMNKSKLGGIMINSDDKNINLHALSYIAGIALKGIYFNTKSAGLKKIREWGNTRESIYNSGNPKKNFFPYKYINNPVEDKEYGLADPDIAKIFDKVRNEVFHAYEMSPYPLSYPKDFLHNFHQNFKESNSLKEIKKKKKADDLAPPIAFLAGNTDIYYMENISAFETAKFADITIAKENILKDSEGNNYISLNSQNNILMQSAKHFRMTCQDADKNREVEDDYYGIDCNLTSLFFGVISKENILTPHGLHIDEQSVSLIGKFNKEKYSEITQSAESIELKPDMDQETSLILRDCEVEMKAEKVLVSGGISIGDAVKEAKDSLIKIGGDKIKITGLKSLEESSVTSILESIRNKETDMLNNKRKYK